MKKDRMIYIKVNDLDDYKSTVSQLTKLNIPFGGDTHLEPMEVDEEPYDISKGFNDQVVVFYEEKTGEVTIADMEYVMDYKEECNHVEIKSKKDFLAQADSHFNGK